MSNQKISEKDFILVQNDKQIHDVKFETKPTTYWKDALKRFLKNKSSVVAAGIISVLTLLAIFVPIFNKNDIETVRSSETLLPPRWPGFENTNIFNGRRKVTGITVDNSDPDVSNHFPIGYDKDAIYGEMITYESTTDIASPYAEGGLLVLRADSARYDTGLQTSIVSNVDFTDEYHLVVNVDEMLNKTNEYELYILAYYESAMADGKKIIIQEMSSEYGVRTFNDISQSVLENRPEGNTGTTFSVRVGIYLPATPPVATSLYINSLVMTNISKPDDEISNPFHKHNFTDGNELLLRRRTQITDNVSNPSYPYRYNIVGSGVQSLYQAKIIKADFEYDFYKAVYGDVVREYYGKSQLETQKNLGYIDFEFIEGDPDSIVRTFRIIDDKKAVVRDVISGGVRTASGKTFYEFTVVISRYREQGFDSIPYYLFGTNDKGHDFFLVAFKGLRTSLILGFSVAFINIIIGLIWGSISGYYGGVVDLFMERITDILGGIPSIIIMTLAILHLGNKFSVFLLSLVITGWIGISSRTRSQFYRYKRREFVFASRTLGAKDGRLIFKHILPNSIGPIVTSAVLMIPSVIFSEASISYLGLGLRGLTSFGVALSEVQAQIDTHPYLIVSASIIIALLMISFNLFGNGLRDALNPSLKGVE